MKLFNRKPSELEQAREAKAQDELHDKVNERFGFIKTDQNEETFYNGNLMMVGAHLTQVCHPNGGTPKEIVSSYIQVMEELLDWFNIVPLRERLDDMLEQRVSSEWSVKEQPVVPAYTPFFLKKRAKDNGDDGW